MGKKMGTMSKRQASIASKKKVSKPKPKPKAVTKKTAPSSKRGLPKAPTPTRIIPGKLPKQKKPAAGPKATACPKGYTPDEYQKFKKFKIQFTKKSNQHLKDLLRKNLQSMSGNKDDLVLKCADGATLGSIPRCPKCFGGRPKYDYKKGTYHCSGYRDDTDFINCHTTFEKSGIKRDKWDN